MRTLLLTVALAATMTAPATMTGTANATTTHAPVVATTGGLVRGVATETNNQFLGIPYAAPPVGALRWQPPRQPAPWHGVRDASQFGANCAQPAGAFDPGSTAEDCLYLNVYAPRGRTHARPVMVWIHGGSLVNGSGSGYDPTDLARDGVVVVTINYRLGALGFLAHPSFAGAPGGPTGDYGLMDQQSALRWVSRNIARFGGSPGNVTIFGESAGGQSVLAHLISPSSRGLFDRAIVQSGTYSLTQATQAAAEAEGQAFAQTIGCADQSAACLRAVPVATLLANQKGLYQPNINGQTLTQSIGTALESGQFARVPVINGTTHDEWRLFVAIGELQGNPVTAGNYVDMIADTLGVPAPAAAAIAAQYPLSAYPSPAVALGAVGTDAIFSCNALTVDNSLSRYVPTFAYEFSDENAPPLLPPTSFPQGAAHAYELSYLFGMPGNLTHTPDQQALAARMRGSWTGFAATGRANWPRYNATSHVMQSLVPPKPVLLNDFSAEHKCGFWSQLTASS
jgi:para-nitrobenzyl esterase